MLHYSTTKKEGLHYENILLQYIRAISEYFPEGVKVSTPRGGFIIWIEMDKRIDAYHLYQEAMTHHISIAPGTMFSLQDKYQNCMRLSYGMQWTPEIDRALKKLGSIVKTMM